MAAGDTINRLRILCAELVPRLEHDDDCALNAMRTSNPWCDCSVRKLRQRAERLGVVTGDNRTIRG